MPNSTLLYALSILVVLFSCRGKSPEDIPKFKKKFHAQIASFESQKLKADEHVDEGVELLNGLQGALEDAQNVDKEFAAVYGKWKRVNKQVENLNKEYEDLKADAENLFSAMERQTASLNDQKTRGELTSAISTVRGDYNKTLSKTAKAIEDLRSLHAEAVDIVKALEVAIGLGQVSQYSEGLKNIESRVAGIMDSLNETVAESKDLYEKRINSI